MGKTITEKILSKASGKNVSQGELVVANVDLAMAHDGTAPLAIKMFREMGGEFVWDPKKIILVIDHVAPSATEGTSSLHKLMRQFSLEQKIENFYDVGAGVGHQLMVERYVNPSMVVVGADSHTCTYGALGAFSTGIGSTEMAAVFKTGKLWFKVPETLKINLNGEMSPHVTPKDLILYLAGQIGADGATYMAVEFAGETVKRMSVDGRLTLCNMAVEMGAKNGLVEPDGKTEEYIRRMGREPSEAVKNDADAEFSEIREYDASSLEPQIACPPRVDNVKPVREVEGLEINQVFLGSCTDGRIEDLQEAAGILAGKKINSHVRMIVVPASVRVYLEALNMGLIKTFLEAGCTVCNPGCGPCVGAHQGIPAPEEVVLSTSNRNFVGRMGCAEADIYLVSPETAAVSALTGRITDPQSWRG